MWVLMLCLAARLRNEDPEVETIALRQETIPSPSSIRGLAVSPDARMNVFKAEAGNALRTEDSPLSVPPDKENKGGEDKTTALDEQPQPSQLLETQAEIIDAPEDKTTALDEQPQPSQLLETQAEIIDAPEVTTTMSTTGLAHESHEATSLASSFLEDKTMGGQQGPTKDVLKDVLYKIFHLGDLGGSADALKFLPTESCDGKDAFINRMYAQAKVRGMREQDVVNAEADKQFKELKAAMATYRDRTHYELFKAEIMTCAGQFTEEGHAEHGGVIKKLLDNEATAAMWDDCLKRVFKFP